jgi:DNA polymerase/3'-5' exonuclease PolX
MYMTLEEARDTALDLIREISPFCKRVEIAGSVRRQKEYHIKDIEIVIIPNNNWLHDLRKFIMYYQGKFPSKYTKFY